MEPAQDTNEQLTPAEIANTNEDNQEVDFFWLVANIFAIISLLEDKFGTPAVEQIVMVATAIENSMRAEAEGSE